MKRKYYLDNLRWLAILLLFPFHAAQIWNEGENGGFYIWSQKNTVLFLFATAVYPWYMTLLFVIAGISCKYSLEKRSIRQFLTERTKKILVPFLFGLFTLVPVMTYIAEIFFNGYTGSYARQWVMFFTKETDLIGYRGGFTPAHLWFLLYLLIISFWALFLILQQKKHFPNFKADGLSYFSIVFMALPEWACLSILNISGKSIGQFMALFLYGYYIFTEESNLNKIKRLRFISLALCILSGSLYIYLYCIKRFENLWWIDLLYIFYGWMGILTLLGIGQAKLDFHNRISDYLSRASFPVYILHMPILVVTGFYVLKLPVSVAGQFLLIVGMSVIITFFTYEIIKKIPFLRALFGMKN